MLLSALTLPSEWSVGVLCLTTVQMEECTTTISAPVENYVSIIYAPNISSLKYHAPFTPFIWRQTLVTFAGFISVFSILNTETFPYYTQRANSHISTISLTKNAHGISYTTPKTINKPHNVQTIAHFTQRLFVRYSSMIVH
jgi:hypothetical protein